MDTPRRKPVVDATWFRQRIAETVGSLSELARRAGWDHAMVSRMLSGGRRMQLTDAHRLAKHLAVPVSEVLRRAGLPPAGDIRTVPLSGWIDAGGAVRLEVTESDDRRVEGPADLPPDCLALVGRTEPLDGSVVFCAKPVAPGPDILGRLCVVGSARRSKDAVLAIVKRAATAQRYTLMAGALVGAAERREDVALAWAAPVLWIRA